MPVTKHFKSGAFLKYTASGDSFNIYWGKGTLSRMLENTYTCYADSFNIHDDRPVLLKTGANHILLLHTDDYFSATSSLPATQSVIILPLRETEPVKTIANHVQTIGKHIVSVKGASEIYIYNYETQKQQTVELYPGIIQSYKSSEIAIRKVQIQYPFLLLTYHAINYQTGKDFITTKKIKLHLQ